MKKKKRAFCAISPCYIMHSHGERRRRRGEICLLTGVDVPRASASISGNIGCSSRAAVP